MIAVDNSPRSLAAFLRPVETQSVLRGLLERATLRAYRNKAYAVGVVWADIIGRGDFFGICSKVSDMADIYSRYRV